MSRRLHWPGETLTSQPRHHEVSNELGNFISGRVQCEMIAVDDVVIGTSLRWLSGSLKAGKTCSHLYESVVGTIV